MTPEQLAQVGINFLPAKPGARGRKRQEDQDEISLWEQAVRSHNLEPDIVAEVVRSGKKVDPATGNTVE